MDLREWGCPSFCGDEDDGLYEFGVLVYELLGRN